MAFRFLALLSLLLCAATLPARAQLADLSPADRDTIRGVIQGQVDAFRRDDGGAAFGYASPEIQEMFGTPDIFMDMVRQGYLTFVSDGAGGTYVRLNLAARPDLYNGSGPTNILHLPGVDPARRRRRRQRDPRPVPR